MTPTFRWVFLLALVGRAASVPRPLVADACALLCNPGAETESERERDPLLFPRYPKVNCKLQSDSDEHQAWVIASHCLKLCNNELTNSSKVNCFALRGSLQANLGCYCEASAPLSPNTMRLHESWRLSSLIKELADDILNTILDSPVDTLILCEIRQELFYDIYLKNGKMIEKCESTDSMQNVSLGPSDIIRAKRSVEESRVEDMWQERTDHLRELLDEPTETEPDAISKIMASEKVIREMMQDSKLQHVQSSECHRADIPSHPDEDKDNEDEDNEDNEDIQDITTFDSFVSEWKRVCKILCKFERGSKYCQCKNPQLAS